jgi:hypothetical protein
MRILHIEKSPKKNKRFRVYLDNDKYYDFGLDTGSTYIDHYDEHKRENYLKRHLGNKKENELINNLIPSPSLFSAYLLWGPYTEITQNIKHLNKLFKKNI